MGIPYGQHVNRWRRSCRAGLPQRCSCPASRAFVWAASRSRLPGPALESWRPGESLKSCPVRWDAPPLQSLVVHQRLDFVHQLTCYLQDMLDVMTLGHLCGSDTCYRNTPCNVWIQRPSRIHQNHKKRTKTRSRTRLVLLQFLHWHWVFLRSTLFINMSTNSTDPDLVYIVFMFTLLVWSWLQWWGQVLTCLLAGVCKDYCGRMRRRTHYTRAVQLTFPRGNLLLGLNQQSFQKSTTWFLKANQEESGYVAGSDVTEFVQSAVALRVFYPLGSNRPWPWKWPFEP